MWHEFALEPGLLAWFLRQLAPARGGEYQGPGPSPL